MDSSPVPFFKKSTPKKNNDEENVQLLAKQMLQSRFFIGNFQEKRYVASLQAYRDVIVVCNDETDLIRDLEVVKKRIRGFYPYDHWVGMTNPETVGAPSGYCLWVELQEDVFGSYWYKIKGVKFKPNEILLKLKVVRPVETSVSNSTLQCSSTFTKESLKDAVGDYMTWLFTTVITLRNTKDTLTFLSVLLVALITGLINILQYLGDFTLKMMREISNLIQVLTPSIIAFINLCAKIVGGFYLLILSMWRTRSTPNYQSPYIAYRSNAITNGNYNTVGFRRALPPPSRRSTDGVIITPLD